LLGRKKMEIPNEILKKIKIYSKQIGRPFKELQDIYTKIYNKDVLDYPNKTAKSHYKRALVALRNLLIQEEGLDRSSAVMFRGFFFGDTDIIDFVEILKRKAIAMYNNPKTRELAIRQHMITRDGIPLDTRKTVDFQENTNYGNPFREDDHSWFQAFFGIAGEGREMKNPRLIKLNNNNPKIISLSYAPYQMYDFRATIRKKSGSSDYLELNATPVTKFKVSDLILNEEEKLRLIRKVANIYSLDELEKVWELSGKDDSERKSYLRQYPILIEANVISIYSNTNEKLNSRVLRLDDMESESLSSKKYTCFLAKHIPIEFGANSRVIFLGSLDKTENRDEEELVINSVGYIVIPELLW